MTRITCTSLDIRLAQAEANIIRIDESIAALVGIVAAMPAMQPASPVIPEAVAEPVAEAKSEHVLMGEENEAWGRMYTTRFMCITAGCTNRSGFYKKTSAERHAEAKGHTFEHIGFSCLR